MDLICACALLFLWYVRPQDIFAVIGGVSVVKYLMYAGILATFRRSQGISLGKFFATPVDWLVACYCLWAIYVTEAHLDAAKEVFTYFSFHVVTALALSSWKRIEIYLSCWLVCLGIVALLAVSSHWGLELVSGSLELTTWFHDRLTLNTWIFRNPNALGHGVMTLIPTSVAWFLMSGAKNRVLGAMLVALAVYCVLLTESKGAFLACAGGLTMLFLFKRPLWQQILLLVTLYALGLAALKSLPRMDTLSKNDEGIQGRMIVWQQAKASMEATRTGEGLKAFHGYVAVRIPKLHRTIQIPIATHGSYVRHGADLGYAGLMLFIGGFYLGGRLLLQARTENNSEARRVQRAIYALLITTAISCWVVDRAYHMDYFLLTGLLSAFHRRLLPPEQIDRLEVDEEAEEVETPKKPVRPVFTLQPKAEVAVSPPTVVEGTGADGDKVRSPAEDATKVPVLSHGRPLTKASAPAGEKVELVGQHEDAVADGREPDMHGAYRLNWHRIGILDLIMMYVLLEVVIYYWELFSTDFVVF